MGELTNSVLGSICKGLNGTERTGGKCATFLGHNDVSSCYIVAGNLVLISRALESFGCDAVLLETASGV